MARAGDEVSQGNDRRPQASGWKESRTTVMRIPTHDGFTPAIRAPEYKLGPDQEERKEPDPERQPEARPTQSAPPAPWASPPSPSVLRSRKEVTACIGNVLTPDAGSGSQVQQTQPAPGRALKVIAFANQKGGVAKTTTTLNLAVAFAEAGHRVLAIDMDPQGNLTMSQGIDPDTVEKSMYHVLVDDMPIREVIRKREVDVACASIDLAGAEIAMSTKIGRERSLEKALKAGARGLRLRVHRHTARRWGC